jgi:hypothetical protein
MVEIGIMENMYNFAFSETYKKQSMKKTYQILASIGLSLLATGAFAQRIHDTHFRTGKAIQAHSRATQNSQTARVLSSPTNVLIDYVNGDPVNNLPSYTFYRWLPPLYMNMNYTLADTIYDPRTSARANASTANYCTVAFDTMWDLWTQQFYHPVITSPAEVDTIWAQMAYQNNSGTNDTVDFEVVAVDAGGFPTATIYGTVQVIFNLGNPLPYNILDSVQTIDIPLASPIMIPNTARHGWNFAINVKVHGSKQDTVGLWYYSPGEICTSYAICNGYTAMGVVDGRAPAVNSFVTGYMWYNDIKNGGSGTQLTWPLTPPSTSSGTCSITAGNYYDQLLAGCTDTSYYYVQDIALYASISFNNPLGEKELSANGFEVGQNYPNPFNQNTVIAYNLAKESNVVFTVHDITGRELVNNSYTTVAAGPHTIELAANQFTAGIYFYTFNVNGVKVTRRMVITE